MPNVAPTAAFTPGAVRPDPVSAGRPIKAFESAVVGAGQGVPGLADAASILPPGPFGELSPMLQVALGGIRQSLPISTKTLLRAFS